MQGEEDFVPLGDLAVAGDISGGHKWGREYVTGIYGVEVRDVIKQPTYTRLPLKQIIQYGVSIMLRLRILGLHH